MVARPNETSPRWAISARTATTNGPTHGAAMMPTPSPEKNAPAMFVVCAPPSRSMSQSGTCISYTPNMPSERTSMRPPSTTFTHTLWSAEPKSPPVSAATTPSAV